MWFVFCAAFTLAFNLVSAHWTEPPIPQYLHVCRKNDPKLDDCVKTSIETIQPVLTSGIPNVEIPSIDPLEIEHLFNSDKKRHGLRITAKDTIVFGISKFKVEDLEVIKFGRLYNIQVSIPKIQVEGSCSISGKIKEFSINETCSFVETFNNTIGYVKAKFPMIDDGWLVQTEKIDVKLKVGESSVKLYDLNKGRRITVEKNVEAIINDVFDEINDDMMPVIEKVLHHQAKDVCDKLLGNFSYDHLFPL